MFVICACVVVALETGRMTSGNLAEVGVLVLEAGVVPSPSLTSDSIARSRSPLRPLRILEFLLSSGNPISLRVTSFHSIPSSVTPRLAPKIRDCLFMRMGDGARDTFLGKSGLLGEES